MDKNRPGLNAAMSSARTGISVLIGTAVVVITLPLAAQAQVAAETVAVSTTDAQKNQRGKSGKPASAKSPAASSRNVVTPVCSGDFSATANVSVPEGKSGLLDLQQLKLPAPAWLRTIGDAEIVKIEPFTSLAPRNSFFLFGQKVGSTNLMFQNKEGRCAMVEVSVGVDTAAVQAKLSQLMPEEKNIKIGAAADSLVLSGTVADAMAVDQVMAIAAAYVRKAGGGAPSGVAGGGSERIVNMLSVAAPQQVMLEVKIAEVSKTLLDKLGVGTTLRTASGSWAYTLLSNFLTGTVGGLLDATKSNGTQVTLEAEKRDGLVRILAEPSVMAISGQEGSFLAGGKIFIPVAQDVNGKITLEEKDFGVGLIFTPTVLAGGRINLRVAPEVSELSREGIGISANGISGQNILPLITTRRASTTVQLNDGQSFAIGGLIKNNVTANIKGLPVLGEVPVLGALFRSTDFQQDRTELLFVITPHLVKPLPPNYALPTDSISDPGRAELFLGGRMEGSKPAVQPSPKTVQRIDPDQAQQNGPTGFELK
jgi:pilus assembly protein CpaC